MTASPVVEFWFEFASTYSYPAAMRIEAAAADRGVAVRWRPFLLGPIFGAQGWTSSPFNLYPAKGRNMWRDLERQCAALSLPLKRPPTIFPQNSLLAARVARLGVDELWLPAFARKIYTANFAEDRDISRLETIAAALADLRLPAELLAQAQSDANKAALKADVEEAMRRGVYGAPTLFAGDELFWGNDRIEAALDWAAGRRPPGF